MNISGIRPYSGFYNINRISQTNPSAMSDEKPAIKRSEGGVSLSVSQQSVDAAKKQQTFGSYDYANQYRPIGDVENKTNASDLRSLDVEKAISDMRKDQAIQQYQVFVGENNAVAVTERGSEDFSL